ncbi:MAG: carbamoyltransferase C-terminal domain-containing protein [Candidatus Hodarchaeota archaeon]
MKILAIHDGHTSGATLFEDGKILGLVSEERFTKKKNQGGFPFQSIDWLIKSTDTDPSGINHIVFPGLIEPVVNVGSNNRSRHKTIGKLSHVLPGQLFSSQYLTDTFIRINRKKREKSYLLKSSLEKYGLNQKDVSFIEHHVCHAATAYYLDWNYSYDRRVLVFTLDGSGDGVSATVSVGHKNKLERIKSIHSFHSLGMLYSRITAFMGMKPLEHEYKLMGMAPYAPEFMMNKSYSVLKKYIQLDENGLGFKNISGAYGNEMIKKFKDDLYMHRFDGISAGLQKLTEELAVEWIINWVRKTGIDEIAVAGGVFMNVKLNMLLNEHSEIKKVFFMPSCGDESIALGAALHKYYEIENQRNRVDEFDNLYFGPEYTNDMVEKVLKQSLGIDYKYHEDINKKVIELILENKIVGRACGKMEFGARSLGNRAIIANPRDYSIVSKINRAIKKRDFWMPFAPSLLPTGAEKYLKSNKKIIAPFMILGFNTKELARLDIVAGCHQSDFSCRPQVVEKKVNEPYYNLLKSFESETGASGLLNTSFNIHGYPIVNSPEDAIWTLKNSDLDAIQIENFIVTRA